MIGRRSACWCVALAGLVLGCADPPATLLVIEVTADPAIAPDELQRLAITVQSLDGPGYRRDEFDLDEVGWFTHSYFVRPGTAEENARVEILVTASQVDDAGAAQLRMQRLVRTRFEARTRKTISVALTRSCLDTVCDAGFDCEDGACVAPGGSVDECAVDADCDGAPPCATDVCRDGTCARTYDDARCDEGEVCTDADCRADCLGLPEGLEVRAPGTLERGFRLEHPFLMPLTCAADATGYQGVAFVEVDQPSHLFVATHGSAVDTVIEVVSCDGAVVPGACADDSYEALTTSHVATTLSEVGRYAVVVGSREERNRSVDLHLYVSPISDTEGDACGNAVPLSQLAEPEAFCGASDDYANCDDDGAPDLVGWFVQDVPTTLTATTCNAATAIDAKVRVVSRCGDVASASCGEACEGRYRLRNTVSVPIAAGLHFAVVDNIDRTCDGVRVDVTTDP